MRLQLLIAALWIAVMGATRAADLPARNMSFQEWDEAKAIPADWSTGAPADSYSLGRDCDAKREGRCVLRASRSSSQGFVPLGQSVPAAPLLGAGVKLSGMIRTRDVSGWAGLWLRIDGEKSAISLDNMQENGPRGTSEWRRFETTLPVPAETKRIAFGILLSGSGAAWFDDLRLEATSANSVATVPDEPGVAMPVASEFGPVQVRAAVAFARLSSVVRFFYPGDAAQLANWDRFLVSGTAHMLGVTEANAIVPELKRLFVPWVDGLEFASEKNALPTESAQGSTDVVQWVHVGYGQGLRQQEIYRSGRTHRAGAVVLEQALADAPLRVPSMAHVELGPGLWAAVPLKLSTAKASATAAQSAALKAIESRYVAEPVEPTRAQSIAAGIALWSFARHFYPYWADVKVDWDGQLGEWIAQQPPTQSRSDLVTQLRRLSSAMRDGHVNVADLKLRSDSAFVPFSFRPVGSEWVVYASEMPEVKPGDIVVAIDGQDAAQVLQDRIGMVSGSPQWRAWRAAVRVMVGPKNSVLALSLDRRGERVEVEVKRTAASPVQPPRPEALAELGDGVWYVDVSRFDTKAFEARLPQMAAAKAVIFDLRGYPSPDARVLPDFWILKAESTQWMFVPLVTAPFAGPAGYQGESWDLQPRTELARARKFLLTDARAISYSESLTGYFASQGQGTIVGEPTAGANGNVQSMRLPGGYSVSMTGMRVTRHDGTVMHGEGFAPDVKVVPTVEGLRAGRDEVLERAIELAKDAK